ncbi:tetratricopeptide repeat protein [Methylovorus mays]|uniref:tetratricopeptide repeat protein n=1 Tax=Methylovorus mays TaxID=184077 RepID=UPI001E34A194|nr:tetratricopeptide repeat protein [Methylovorus mays]MCB5206668.1 tetratricopeptide repeat protein [Methylovorus mays]
MKTGFQQARQPGQSEMHALIGLLNAGHMPQAEATARAMLRQYPQTLMLHNVLGIALESQQKYADAAVSYRNAIALEPKIAEIHFNLGVVLGHLGRMEEAIASYRKAISLKPDLAVAYFNLGFALQTLGRYEEAIPSYRKAAAMQPTFYEAHGNLGTVLQKQGKTEDAIASYRKALDIHADARGYFNLATALRDHGQLEDAVTAYRAALRMQPDYADAWNNLGEALRDQGNMDEAVKAYQQALQLAVAHPAANYNLAEFLYLAAEYAQAIPYFERSQLGDWQERILYCLYKSGQFDAFKARLPHAMGDTHASPFLATLSTHYSTNFGVPDSYRFCPQPMDYVFHSRIAPLAEQDSTLLHALLKDITLTEIAERKQGRLHHGIQSAGNLFKRSEASFKTLAQLIKQQVQAFREHYAGQDCELIEGFPDDIEFTSSWYVKMQKGGHLTSHIHEIGWLSGCVYLAIPKDKQGEHDGSIEFSTDGDEYPRQHDDFPVKVIAPQVGDIVLFPSSLFHRTIPFNSNEERICVAFDIKPRVAKVGAAVTMTVAWMAMTLADILEIGVVSLRYAV